MDFKQPLNFDPVKIVGFWLISWSNRRACFANTSPFITKIIWEQEPCSPCERLQIIVVSLFCHAISQFKVEDEFRCYIVNSTVSSFSILLPFLLYISSFSFIHSFTEDRTQGVHLCWGCVDKSSCQQSPYHWIDFPKEIVQTLANFHWSPVANKNRNRVSNLHAAFTNPWTGDLHKENCKKRITDHVRRLCT